MVMRQHDLWQDNRPSAQALNSRQPFCIDTLSFNQWLQFIFIERIKTIIETEAPLPESSQIAPMAEEFFKSSDDSGKRIIKIMAEFDAIITG